MDEQLKNKLTEFARERADNVYDVDINELVRLVVDGAEWMFDELKCKEAHDKNYIKIGQAMNIEDMGHIQKLTLFGQYGVFEEDLNYSISIAIEHNILKSHKLDSVLINSDNFKLLWDSLEAGFLANKPYGYIKSNGYDIAIACDRYQLSNNEMVITTKKVKQNERK